MWMEPLGSSRLFSLAAEERQAAQPAEGQQSQRGGFGHGADGQIHGQWRIKSGLVRLIGSGIEIGEINRNEGGLSSGIIEELMTGIALVWEKMSYQAKAVVAATRRVQGVEQVDRAVHRQPIQLKIAAIRRGYGLGRAGRNKGIGKDSGGIY